MKPALKLACAVVFACSLSACMSSEERTTYVPAEKTGSTATVVTDEAYVAVVERTARRRGIGVHWVNVPTRRVKQD